MNYEETNALLDKMRKDLPDVAGIVFLYMWDIIRDVFTDVCSGDNTWGEYMPTSGTTLETVWKEFNENLWGDFQVDGGNVLDWLQEHDLIIDSDYLDEEGEEE